MDGRPIQSPFLQLYQMSNLSALEHDDQHQSSSPYTKIKYKFLSLWRLNYGMINFKHLCNFFLSTGVIAGVGLADWTYLHLVFLSLLQLDQLKSLRHRCFPPCLAALSLLTIDSIQHLVRVSDVLVLLVALHTHYLLVQFFWKASIHAENHIVYFLWPVTSFGIVSSTPINISLKIICALAIGGTMVQLYQSNAIKRQGKRII